jgi:hypothetical protein
MLSYTKGILVIRLLNSFTLDLTDFVLKPQINFRQVMLSCKIDEHESSEPSHAGGTILIGSRGA